MEQEIRTNINAPHVADPGPAIRPFSKPEKSSWKEYLLQFVLMFLAIFFGFLADNIRENQVDQVREKKYIRSIINDLKTDTAKLTDNIQYCERLIEGQDSAITLLYSQYNKAYNENFFHFLGAFRTMPVFIPNDATLEQLKNSGGFLTISSALAQDSIMLYEARVKQTLLNESIMGEIFRATEQRIAAVFNLRYFQKAIPVGHTIPKTLAPTRYDHIFSADRLKWAELHNQLLHHTAFLFIIKSQREDVREQATDLIRFLGKEYAIQ